MAPKRMNYDHILISQQFKYNSSLVKVAISLTKNEKGKQLVEIDKSLCTGCSLCSQVCPVKAIN